MGKNRVVDFYSGQLGSFQSNNAIEREQLIERMYIKVLSELAMNRFKWSGMPKQIELRYLELELFRHALSVFYDDSKYGYLALQGTPAGMINMVQNPTAFTVTGPNFVSRTVSAKDCVPIWANYMRTPDLDIVLLYASRFANFDRTIEINSMNARQTKIIKAGNNQRLSMVNIARQIDQGVPVIQYNKNGPMDLSEDISVLDMGVHPDTIEKLDIIRARQWNVCMGLLGISNANQDKKERLVADEVSANNEQTDNMKLVNLNARRYAAERINQKFGLNVTVEYNTDVEERASKIFDAMLNGSFDAEVGNV